MQINTIRIKIGTQSQQRSGTPEIEELSPPGDEQENSKGEGHCEADIKSITINNIPIGEASSPYEVIRIQTESRLVSVVIIYDTGSEVSLCNYET